jgi:hypothetical protein
MRTGIKKEDMEPLIAHVQALHDFLISLGFPAAAAYANRAIAVFKRLPFEPGPQKTMVAMISTPDADKLRHDLGDLINRVADDFASKHLLVLDQKYSTYFDQAKLFGNDVFNNFPSANDDIIEAGTCLALNRSTACVMHLMRVLEVGLSVLAGTLNVTKQNDWGSYLREIDKELATRIKASGARSADEQFYAAAAASLDNMRRAYRNPTMHPEKTYSSDRAEEILQSVKSFMIHLATKLHE